jgi:phosphatidylglycerol---prolipoprotein diacylglyceryl transferase
MNLSCPFIDPILISFGPFKIPWLGLIGPLEVRWYGFMYLMGFCAAYFVIRSELKRKQGPIPAAQADDMLFYLIVGLLIGARIGYVLFYNLEAYLAAPWEIFFVWYGGMSFHGGLIGMVISGYLFARQRHVNFLELADIGALAAPIGLLLGRIGNFINCELFGRVTTAPWGIVFPAGGNLPRHPSQLYEAFFEGLVLFCLLWFSRTRITRYGQVLALFLVGYGVFRFSIEFFREPDPQLGFLFHWLTMGQILCAFMILTGVLLFVYLHFRGTLISKG